MRDEGRPLGTVIQVIVSDHLKVLLSKAMVLSVKEKAKRLLCQISVMEMNESELLMTLRKDQSLSEPKWMAVWDEFRRNLFID